MLRILTNSKETVFTTITIPTHMQHGYNWAEYKQCNSCRVLIAPLVFKKLWDELQKLFPGRTVTRCPNCGSLFNTGNVSNTYSLEVR
jgi:hypothetical protein